MLKAEIEDVKGMIDRALRNHKCNKKTGGSEIEGLENRIHFLELAVKEIQNQIEIFRSWVEAAPDKPEKKKLKKK